jgi:hypothetical protein
MLVFGGYWVHFVELQTSAHMNQPEKDMKPFNCRVSISDEHSNSRLKVSAKLLLFCVIDNLKLRLHV